MLIRRSAALVASLAGLAAAFPAAAQTIPWLTATTGNWSETARWTGGNVPNAAGEIAEISIAGTYTVTQNINGLELDEINVLNSNATLRFNAGTTALLGAGIYNLGTVVTNGNVSIVGPFTNGDTGHLNVLSSHSLTLNGPVVNNEEIVVNPTTGASTTSLSAAADLSITGNGIVILNAPTSRAQITGAGTITFGAGQTVRGFGQILASAVFNGSVIANVSGQTLFLSSSEKTNNGLIAADLGTIGISGITITQTPSASIEALSSNVDLTNATISGGTLASTAPSLIRCTGGTSLFNDVDSDAEIHVLSSATLALAGSAFSNNGLLVVNPSHGLSTTSLRIDGPLTVDGTGAIALNGTGSRAQITANDGASHLTLGAGQLLRGFGVVSVPMTNLGVVHADVASFNLRLLSSPKANEADILASGGAMLSIEGISVTQGASGVIAADGGTVQLSSATISGGLITSSGTGVFRTTGGSSTLANVESAAAIEVMSSHQLTLAESAFVNNGVLTVNPGTGTSATSLRIDGPISVGGTGTIALNAPTVRAQVISAGGPTDALTLGPGQLLRGYGNINVAATNNGTISADVGSQTLQLTGSPKTNNANIRAGGGTLFLNAFTLTQAPAALLAADGSNVDLSNATINGGTIISTGPGLVRQTGGTSVLNDVDSLAEIHVLSSTVLALQGGAFTNNGSVTVNPPNGASATALRIDGPTTIDGIGDIHLTGSGVRGQIGGSGPTATLALGPGQTVTGIGQIALGTTLEGTIAPGNAGPGTLSVTPAATITWQPGSSLEFEINTLASYDKVAGGSHAIAGGTIDVSIVGPYTPALFDTFTVIDGSGATTVTGRFNGVNGPALPANWVWKASYTAQDVIVGVTCPSDYNADFAVDILDFLDFLDDLGVCEGQPAPCGNINADYNDDGFVDILDFLDFLDNFGSGC